MKLSNTSIELSKDDAGIVRLVMDRKGSRANLMDFVYAEDFAAAAQCIADDDDIRGIIISSSKDTFFAGGDLNFLGNVSKDDSQNLFDLLESLKASMRILETKGVPVVSCINGAALGGGWELALSSHHRIAIDSKSVVIGLPEATLGLLPGAGGVTRMVRLLGLEQALPLLTEGKKLKVHPALEAGLIHEIVADAEGLEPAAIAWINRHQTSQQPWDVKGYKVPGGKPGTPALAQKLPGVPAMMRKQTHGCLPAPEAILSAAVEGLQVDFDTACRIESRYFVGLATGPVAKNLINTFWFQLNDIKARKGRPDVDAARPEKLAVLGAGMMGAGIALACAKRGIPVTLIDTSLEKAEQGKAYTANFFDKGIKRGRVTEQQKLAALALITASDDVSTVSNADLVIEAVFEDKGLKADVTKQLNAAMKPGAVIASNTSTIPITQLAKASEYPDKFIGLHFFSPVEKMPLVEIICGKDTADHTLALAWDVVEALGKTPIVVNDSRGFYTSRVFGTFTKEGMAMVNEGVAPAAIENGAFLAGFPVGPLAVIDEVTLTLLDKVRTQYVKAAQEEQTDYIAHPGDITLDRMLELERPGRFAGKGFYDYPQDGKKRLWAGLTEHFSTADTQIALQDIKDRLLFIQALETARCMEENVLTTSRDANIGSVMGIGFPAWTGGTIQFINQYGVAEFVARANELADLYGERFRPCALLIDMAKKAQNF